MKNIFTIMIAGIIIGLLSGCVTNHSHSNSENNIAVRIKDGTKPKIFQRSFTIYAAEINPVKIYVEALGSFGEFFLR